LLLLVTLFLRREKQWLVLLFFSIIFYGYDRWHYLILLLTSVSIDYLCALVIDRTKSAIKRRLFLGFSIFANLSILFFFKYFVEIYAEWSWIEARNAVLGIQFDKILLPLGISFYTLQSMGYTIDVYRKEVPAERHFGYFALYVCFFPQLVAGPIERPKSLIPQLKNPTSVNLGTLQEGLFLIGFGLFKKLIVADRLFLIIQTQIDQAGALDGWQALSFGTVAFFAVYFDISAYTDIARGSARLFGVNLSRNFNRPMLALSTGDFWRRWHMSLSGWMMHYLYRPLAQLHRSKAYRNWILLVTFTMIGLWHGPTLPFILMGALQGIVIVAERVSVSHRFRWPNTRIFDFMRLVRTHAVINVSGMLFMSPDLETFLSLFHNVGHFDDFWHGALFLNQVQGIYSVSILCAGLFVIALTDFVKASVWWSEETWVTNSNVVRAIGLYALFGCVILFGERSSADFLYFFF